MVYFYLALSFMGLYRGFSTPPLESIYADSVITGSRRALCNSREGDAIAGQAFPRSLSVCSSLYTAKHITQLLSSCVGPAISILLFVYLGNDWTVRPAHLAATYMDAGNAPVTNQT